MSDIRTYEGSGRRTSLFALSLAALVAVAACGDDTSSGGSPSTGGGGAGAGGGNPGGGGEGATGGGGAPQGGGGMGAGGAGGEATGGTGGGGGAPVCDTTADGATRGSSIAMSPTDSKMVAVNRDNDSITVFDVDFVGGQATVTKEESVGMGVDTTPWQVVVNACGDTAYVVLRESQEVVEITNFGTTNDEGARVSVGSEPSGIAISPNNTQLYVSNWVEGTVSVIDAATMTVVETVDLNATLAATGLIGTVTARPSLAHPRAIAVTNDGDGDDSDERILVTEWFAQRVEAEQANGSNADTSKKGLVYSIQTSNFAASTIDVPNVANTGFNNSAGVATGCFPNQLNSLTIDGSFAYVTSTCASPEGPLGVAANAGACTTDAQCGVTGVCNTMTNTCTRNTINAKSTTHPALTIIDLGSNTGATTLLDAVVDAQATPKRMPLLPTDVAVYDGNLFLVAQGADSVFEIETNGTAVASVSSFINVRPTGDTAGIRIPNGITTAFGAANPFAFTNNEGNIDVSTIDLSDNVAMAVTASEPPPTGAALERLKGERFFVTGLGRWSLNGEAWGSCAACHIDGLSDNVTWYFARGPRQSTSLEGSFSKTNPADQRIFNWTSIFDEMADFEGNTRNVSGGKGAIVDAMDVPINTATQTPPQQGLQGASDAFADPAGPSDSSLADWNEITVYARGVRPPKRPVGLDATAVAAGKVIFESASQGNCVGCHSGSKWTISTRFYTPGPGQTDATAALTGLGVTAWPLNLNGFPAGAQPVDQSVIGSRFMRFGAPPGAEQLQCMLRPVGTFNVAPASVGVAEVRADMTTAAQGNANNGRGFNPPSLLGMQVGAPFFHAGQARTLEELFDALFVGHHQSALAGAGFNPNDTQKAQLVQFILSIDTEQQTIAIPALGPSGGDFCAPAL